jgi:3-oxoacyl-[acyl-carrier-protein] synthase-3
MVKNISGKNKCTSESVDYYIFHQANRYMLNTIRKICQIPQEKFYINLTETGNTVSSTILIALKDCLENNVLHSGMNVMISGFGVGLSWGGTMLKIL